MWNGTKRILSVAVLVFAGAMSLGQASLPSGAVVPPASRVDPFLTPYVDEQTILVAHLDVGTVDSAVLEKYVVGLLDEAKVPGEDESRRNVTTSRAAVDVFLTRFKQLGGRHLYLVMSHPDIWPHMQPMALLVKAEPGGDARMLRQFLTGIFGISDLSPEEMAAAKVTPEDLARRDAQGELKAAMLRDDVIFLGHPAALKRLQGIKPVARPELALGAAAPLEAAAALTADERRALHELMPALPPELGGGSTEFLTREGLSLRMQVVLPPNPLVTLTFSQALTMSGANTYSGATVVSGGGVLKLGGAMAEMDDFIARLRDMALASDEFKTALRDPTLKPIAADVQRIAKEVLTPHDGVLRVDGSQVGALTQLAFPLSLRMRAHELEAQTASSARGIAQAAIIYSVDHKDMLPESTDVLVKEGAIPEKELYSPRDPKHRKFIYKAIVPVNTTDAGVPLVWEDVDADADGLVVAFADGHAEWITRKGFEEALKEADRIKAKMEAEQKK